MEQRDGNCQPKSRGVSRDRFSRYFDNARKKQRHGPDYQQRAEQLSRKDITCLPKVGLYSLNIDKNKNRLIDVSWFFLSVSVISQRIST